MRTVTINYKTINYSTLADPKEVYVMLDNENLGYLLPDQYLEIDIDDNEHSIYCSVVISDVTTLFTDMVLIPTDKCFKKLKKIKYIYNVYLETTSFGTRYKSTMKNMFLTLLNPNQAVDNINRDCFTLSIVQPDENEREVRNNIRENEIFFKGDEAIENILDQFWENPCATIDFSLYDRLTEEAKDFSMMRDVSYPILIERVYFMLCMQYFENSMSIRYMLFILSRLKHIEECKDVFDTSLNNFKYIFMDNNDINSVFTENVIEELEYLKKNPVEADMFDAREYEKMRKKLEENEKEFNGDYVNVNGSIPKTVFDFIVKADEGKEYFERLKKTLIGVAFAEKERPDFAPVYSIFTEANDMVFTPWVQGKNVIKSKTVDMLIADAIHYTNVNSINNIDNDLKIFLEKLCPDYDIDASQYTILQKVFANLHAYKQETMVLEAMIKNGVQRKPEQDERLAFLKKNGSNASLGRMTVNIGATSNVTSEDGKLLYDYRLFTMNENDMINYFNELSMANNTISCPIVVDEWSKNIEANNINWNASNICERINLSLKKNFGDKYTSEIIESGLMSEDWQEYVPSILVSDVSNNGYPWLEFVVSGDQLMINQLALSIYSLYVPEKDTLSSSNYDRNASILRKVQMLKQNQNPKMHNIIEIIKNLMVKELELWINSAEDNNIYN